MTQSRLRLVSGVPLIREKLTRLYAARVHGNLAAFAAGFRPDGVFHLVGDARLVPEAGRHRGRAAIETALRSLYVNFQYLDGLLVDMVVDLDAAAVRRHVTVRSRATGAVGEFEIAEHLSLDNGEIVELVQFMDTASMAVLAGRI